ncbi:MAG: small heat shock protein Hsp20 [Cyanobacteria bacterium RYN_339]|nr:small heat shock protein Hsp20 [Cyanobacteria bacterium RYN_339]
MNLARWNPLEEMERMQHDMGRLFGRMGMRGLPALETNRTLMPTVEVFTTETEVVVKAELPGMQADGVEVEITEDSIHLSGEFKQEEEIKEDNYYRSERQFGSFERMIPLPNRIKDTEAKATFKHGILEIRAPLAEEVKRPTARKLAIGS